MISFAQNYEDVLLNRIFFKRQSGFYLDIGAHDPVHMSITKHFYDKGWRGINIEPVKHCFEKFLIQRPQDVNLNIAVCGKSKFGKFYELSKPAMSTFNEKFAHDACTKLGLTFKTYQVSQRTLQDICQQYCSGKEIDFMNIDVEGMENEILLGADFNSFRPLVLITESTIPNTVPDFSKPFKHKNWEETDNILTAQGYLFAYFNGLNRFYVRKENKELIEFFRIPVGMYDGHKTHAIRLIELENQRLKEETLKSKKRLEILKATKDELLYRLNNRFPKNILVKLRKIFSRKPTSNQNTVQNISEPSPAIRSDKPLAVKPHYDGKTISSENARDRLHHTLGFSTPAWDKVKAHCKEIQLEVWPEFSFNGYFREAKQIDAQRWSGILLDPPRVPDHYIQAGYSNFLQSPVWLKSKASCQVLFTLNNYHARILSEQLDIPIRVISPVYQPDASLWSLDAFKVNPQPKLIQFGWWFRNLHSIYELTDSGLQKAVCFGVENTDKFKTVFQLEQETRKRKGLFFSSMYDTVETIDLKNDQDYNKLLAANILYFNFYDYCYDSIVIDCIARATPFLIHRLPAVVELLGVEYPFYFCCHDEASEKSGDIELIHRTHQYLRSLTLKKPMSIDACCNLIRSSIAEPVQHQKNLEQ